MELLQAGVDRAVIALWLGHESVETTQIYLDADLALKEQALAKTKPIKGAPSAFNRTMSCWPSSNNSDPKPPDYAASRMIVSNQTSYSEGLEPHFVLILAA